MKINIFLLVILTSIAYTNAQTININPDKTGEPWIVGGLRVPSQEEINKIPQLNIPSNYKTTKLSLPSYLDNSTNAYFRPIFNQTHGSCAQASGVAYTFTYEMNRIRQTSANTSTTQYPSHYTYNFLNGGSGSNGSWYTDGWLIIKANGCPNIATYGGIAANETFWMSGYSKYESSMNNRVKDFFSINVRTEHGLNNLKYWLLNHFEGNTTGGIVNFAAGVTGEFHMTYNDIIVEWGRDVNHAMTIVGWDDTIEYDYNTDGIITNHIDINSDGVVNMKDWEKGALIMVNSWGTSWGNQGKAYVMYKTLAEYVGDGGIYMNAVYGIHVKETQTPQLTLKVKMAHNSRKKIKLIPGVSTDLADIHPQNTVHLPIFTSQGGDNYMRGNTNSSPIEINIDISALLSYITPNEMAKFFLVIQEIDLYSGASGEVIDFSIIDSNGNEYFCNSHNVPINNSSFTFLSINASPEFEFPTIETESLPIANVEEPYSYQLTASGGTTPYNWRISQDYTEEIISESFPTITSNKLVPNNNDDGIATHSLDFEFPFYGELYQEIYLSTDGSVLFNPNFSIIRNEEAIINNKVISVFAYDLLIDNSSQGIFYEGDSNSATFRWKTCLYGNTSANIDVAVTLYPNGNIEYYYGNNITTDLNWSAGLSDGNKSYEILSISGESNPSNLELKMNMEPYPIGLSIDENGLLEGTLNEEGTWNLDFVVTDNNLVSDNKTLTLTTETASISEITEYPISIFPNPTSNHININYTLLRKSDVNISIYDLYGRLIDTIVNETKSIGEQKIIYTPKINKGLYILKIQTNDFIYSKKIIYQ